MRRLPSHRLLAALFAAAALFGADRAEGQTVGYSLEPGASYVEWDEELGLESGWLLGGGLAFELGPRVRLTPFYLQADGIEADPTGLMFDDAPLFPDAEPLDLDVRHYGVDMDIDLLRSAVTPFVRLGGGILRLEPSGEGERLERIVLSYGAGLRFGVGRTSVRVSASNKTFRFDPARLYDPAAAMSVESDKSNWMGNARVSIPISTQRESRDVGLVTSSAPLGVFVGSLDFADEMEMGTQRLAGVQAGLAFNPLVSVTGFYWQGVNDDFDDTQDLRGYGAEAQFELGSGTGVSPFLVVGGARLDYDQDSDDPRYAEQSDKTALILGGGLSFRLTDRVDLQASVRDYLVDTTRDLEDASDPGELVNNWLYSVGASLRVGGTTAEARSRQESRALAEERARLEEQIRRLEAGEPRMPADSLVVAETPVDTVAASDAPRARIVEGPEGRQIVLPVLEEGSIYIRFGPEGWDTQGATAGETRGMVMDRENLRDIIRQEVQGAAGDSAQGLSLAELEERLFQRLRQPTDPAPSPGATGLSPEVVERLDAIERRLMQRLDAMQPSGPVPPTPARTEERRETGGAGSSEGAFSRVTRFDAQSVLPLGGLSLGGDATQAMLGARFDFGFLKPDSRIKFVPEIAVGLGGDETTFTALGTFQIPLLTGSSGVEPYVSGGAGLFTPSFLGISTAAGVAFDFGGIGNGARSYAELQGINFFDTTRLLFGLSFPL